MRQYSILIARRLGVEARLLGTVAVGALLHDIGKIGIADAVLLKKGALDEAEWTEMRRHPELGAALIGTVRFLAGARELVLAHHERFDGSGYPRRLAGDAIPLAARILAVADTFDAMTTNRPYHRQRSFDEARSAIRDGRGSQFDPRVADAFLELSFEVLLDAASRHGVQLLREEGERGQPVTKRSKDAAWDITSVLVATTSGFSASLAHRRDPGFRKSGCDSRHHMP